MPAHPCGCRCVWCSSYKPPKQVPGKTQQSNVFQGQDRVLESSYSSDYITYDSAALLHVKDASIHSTKRENHSTHFELGNPSDMSKPRMSTAKEYHKPLRGERAKPTLSSSSAFLGPRPGVAMDLTTTSAVTFTEQVFRSRHCVPTINRAAHHISHISLGCAEDQTRSRKQKKSTHSLQASPTKSAKEVYREMMQSSLVARGIAVKPQSQSFPATTPPPPPAKQSDIAEIGKFHRSAHFTLGEESDSPAPRATTKATEYLRESRSVPEADLYTSHVFRPGSAPGTEPWETTTRREYAVRTTSAPELPQRPHRDSFVSHFTLGTAEATPPVSSQKADFVRPATSPALATSLKATMARSSLPFTASHPQPCETTHHAEYKPLPLLSARPTTSPKSCADNVVLGTDHPVFATTTTSTYATPSPTDMRAVSPARKTRERKGYELHGTKAIRAEGSFGLAAPEQFRTTHKDSFVGALAEGSPPSTQDGHAIAQLHKACSVLPQCRPGPLGLSAYKEAFTGAGLPEKPNPVIAL